jgi:hypothetical protein
MSPKNNQRINKYFIQTHAYSCCLKEYQLVMPREENSYDTWVVVFTDAHHCNVGDGEWRAYMKLTCNALTKRRKDLIMLYMCEIG